MWRTIHHPGQLVFAPKESRWADDVLWGSRPSQPEQVLIPPANGAGTDDSSPDLAPAPLEDRTLKPTGKGQRGGWQAATYFGVLAFCIVYFFRPEDFLQALGNVPFAKVAGLFTGAALVGAIVTGSMRVTSEIKLLVLLFADLCLCIPLSSWPGGSFDLIFSVFAKYVLIVIATICAVTTLKRLRRLLLIQTLAMLTMSVLALTQDLRGGRMYGVGELFGDPNDFALNLCIILPICVAMLLSTRRWVTKALWSGATILAVLTIVSTYSRGGFLALMAVLVAMWWRFRVRTNTVIFSTILMVCSLAIAISVVGTSSYLDRLKSIADPQEDVTGSAEARKQLLIRSLELTAQHPLFGVGPGQFNELSKAWHESHNSYTQLSSEAGIPALLIFLALMRRGFKNLRLRKTIAKGTQAWYLAGGLYCAMVGYAVGAFFLSTAFWLVPYLLVAYTTALANLSDGRALLLVEQPKLRMA